MRRSDVTLFVMARNEQRCIERCISSVAHVVDDVIVLDTGSTDDTVEIVKSMNCRVHQIDWPNDFSKARNIGLSFVKTPWVLTLDADEWVIEASAVADQFSRLSNATARVYEVGMYMMKYGLPSQNTTSRQPKFWTPRLFMSNFRYRNAIHEVLDHKTLVSRSKIILGHDGYEKEQFQAKRGRNLQLLRRQLAENPTDGLLHYYIAQELRAETGAEANPETAERYGTALRLMVDSDPLKEIVFRAALGHAENAQDYEGGIRIIFESLSAGVRSIELSYLAGEFLIKCARSGMVADRALILGVAKQMFIRVATSSDKKSRFYESGVDLSRLAKKRLQTELSSIGR
jgi:hypothetical protein